MSHQQFIVSDTNPNDTAGGGGCICDPKKQIDCKPPYVIFYGNDMEAYNSPHVVVCKSCAEAASAALAGEILSAGERGPDLPATVAAYSELPAPVTDDDVPEV